MSGVVGPNYISGFKWIGPTCTVVVFRSITEDQLLSRLHLLSVSKFFGQKPEHLDVTHTSTG